MILILFIIWILGYLLFEAVVFYKNRLVLLGNSEIMFFVGLGFFWFLIVPIILIVFYKRQQNL